MRRRALSLLLLVLAAPSLARAGGFSITEGSTRGMAQGGAVVAEAKNAAAVFYNPALLPFLDADLNALVGVTTYIASARYENPETGAGVDALTDPEPVPFGYVSYRPLEGLAFGLGANTRYGLGLEWPADWEGRDLVTGSRMDSSTLTLAASWAFLDWLSIGLSFDTTFGAAEMSRSLDLGLARGTFRFGGHTVGFSGSAAVYLRPVDWFALGVTYHGPTRMVLADGNVDFDVPNRFAELFPDQHADTVIVLPDMIWMGIRFWPLPELSIELDVVQVQWSHYDALVFEFEEGIGDPPADEEVLRTDWHDSPEVRFGVAWDTPLPGLTTFAGFMYETLVIPKHRIDPTLPDNERFDTSFGLAYTRWGVTLTGS